MDWAKPTRGALCDFPGCKRVATYWSGFKIQLWDPNTGITAPPRIVHRCEDHCNPNKWFELEEEDYE